ncbi:hypothetical protein M4951_18405 [Blastopirellula sp. J2-11]|uniref:hypothetical protein n=1 Tax=Blastopirellula sp. J2-11 TaxID=2943192 RepID=UPI0021C5FA3B|nr:hypothetical protein [Blastopirellula sp. J2-11]UUO05341.1 hypothetical protein M4951_18405 [Blastopirellula sp. J2-11]
MIWSIDKELKLAEVAELPSSTSALECPEQLIDTVILRNLNEITRFLVGQDSRFLFRSTEYWGPFDIGTVLRDGTLFCLENKAKSVDRKGFLKFLEDINTVKKDASSYASQRYRHVVMNHEEYLSTAKRMFSGFFLLKRCDNLPQSRDLATEAATLLGISPEEYHQAFLSQTDWLVAVGGAPSFDDYIESFTTSQSLAGLSSILLITKRTKNRVRNWILETPDAPVDALLGTYEFLGVDGRFPQFLSMDASEMFGQIIDLAPSNES